MIHVAHSKLNLPVSTHCTRGSIRTANDGDYKCTAEKDVFSLLYMPQAAVAMEAVTVGDHTSPPRQSVRRRNDTLEEKKPPMDNLNTPNPQENVKLIEGKEDMIERMSGTSNEEETNLSTPQLSTPRVDDGTPSLRRGKGIKRAKKKSPVLDDVSKDFMNAVEEMITKCEQLTIMTENNQGLDGNMRYIIDELDSWARTAKRLKGNIRYQPEIRKDKRKASSSVSSLISLFQEDVPTETIGHMVEMNNLREIIEDQKKQMKEQEDEAEEICRKQNQKIKELQEKAQEFYEKARTCTKCKNKINEEEMKLEKTREQLQRVTDLTGSETEELIRSRWPESLYQKTTIKVGNPFKSVIPEFGSVILVAGQNDKSMLLSTAKTRYPELALLQEPMNTEEEDQQKYNELESSVTVGNKTIKNKIYLVRTDNEEDVKCALEEILDRPDEENLSMIATEKHNWNTLRKITEVKCIKTNKEMSFFVPHNKQTQPNTTQLQTREPKKKIREINVAIPENRKGDYDVIAKKIKREVLVADNEAEVVSMDKTKDTNIKILIDEKVQGATEIIEKKINECIGEAGKAGIHLSKRDCKTIIVRDIDTTITKEELTEELKKSTGSDEIVVINLKLNYTGSSQTASLQVAPSLATKLISQARIKIDWNWARVEEMVTLNRCYRCLDFGHVSFECSAEVENRNTSCFKCGQEGHRANSCTQAAFCKTCNTAGHRSDSMACPHYRKLVAKKKREAQNKR